MEIKYCIVFYILVVAMAQDSGHESNEPSDEESTESTTQLITETEETNPDANKDYFINRVHTLASNISKHLVIHDNKVVWSPFAVVNAMTLISGDDPVLVNGFQSAGTFLSSENALNSTFISLGYTKNEDILKRNITGLKLYPLEENQDVNQLLQEAFLNVTHFEHNSNHSNHNSSGSHGNSSNHELRLNDTETVLLRGFGIEALWATPFHPRYAKKSKFFLNSTHVVKTKFMNNIGFYKFAELEEFDAVAVAMPMKQSPRTYAIFIKPNNPDDLETLNTRFENVENFTDIFRIKFRTRRVQVSLPRVDLDSQFPITLSPNTSTLHVSSLLISYTGLYNNFHHAPHHHRSRPIRFTRLRRRPDDAKLKLNSPFLFHVYDDQFSGFLLSGLVLNPQDTSAPLHGNQALQIPHEIKLAKETSNHDCLQNFHDARKKSGIYENVFVRCDSTNSNYTEILNSNVLNFTFTSEKLLEKRFYSNEIDYKNVSMGESVLKVRYGSFGELLDGRVVRLKVHHKSLYIFYPNERSGLSRIEETLENIPLSVLNCQMRDVTVRLRLPELQDELKVGFEKISKRKNVVDLVPIERRGKSTKRYRQLTIDRSFLYIITEETLTSGGIIAIGRIISPN